MLVAEQARHLFVFQRTAAFNISTRNKPLDIGYETGWKFNYVEHHKQILETVTDCLISGMKNCSAMSVIPEERLEEFEKTVTEKESKLSRFIQ